MRCSMAKVGMHYYCCTCGLRCETAHSVRRENLYEKSPCSKSTRRTCPSGAENPAPPSPPMFTDSQQLLSATDGKKWFHVDDWPNCSSGDCAVFFFPTPFHSVVRSQARVRCTVLGKKQVDALCFSAPLISSLSSRQPIWALFSSKIFGKISTVAISFVFDKYCPIMD